MSEKETGHRSTGVTKAARPTTKAVVWPMALFATREGDWKAYGATTPPSVKLLVEEALNEKTMWPAYPAFLAVGIIGRNEEKPSHPSVDVGRLIALLSAFSQKHPSPGISAESGFMFVAARDVGVFHHAEIKALDGSTTRAEVAGGLTRLLRKSGLNDENLQPWYQWWMDQKFDLRTTGKIPGEPAFEVGSLPPDELDQASLPNLDGRARALLKMSLGSIASEVERDPTLKESAVRVLTGVLARLYEVPSPTCSLLPSDMRNEGEAGSLTRATLPPTPEDAKRHIVDEFRALALADPTLASQVVEEFGQIAVDVRPIDHRRVLTAPEAEEMTGIPRRTLIRRADASRNNDTQIAFGEFRNGQWQFSKTELEVYKASNPKRGRPKTLGNHETA